MHYRLVIATLAVTLLGGCATMPNPFAGTAQPSHVASGAAIGAIVGAATGTDPRVGTLIGAGVGALTGAGVGAYMDAEEADLRAQLGTSGISITRAGEQIVLNLPAAVAFDSDKAQVKPQFNATLASLGQLLKKYEKTLVDVYGYTDSQGSDGHNKDLSQRRAVAVAAVLANQGVSQQRFYIEGRGEADPIGSNDTEVGRAQNRRVEIQLSPITAG